MARVKVTVFGAKALGSEEVGLLVLKIKYPPGMTGKKNKRRRRDYADGVADGVARVMAHYQPEGDGF